MWVSRLWVSTYSHVDFTHSLTSITKDKLHLSPAVFPRACHKYNLGWVDSIYLATETFENLLQTE